MQVSQDATPAFMGLFMMGLFCFIKRSVAYLVAGLRFGGMLQQLIKIPEYDLHILILIIQPRFYLLYFQSQFCVIDQHLSDPGENAHDLNIYRYRTITVQHP